MLLEFENKIAGFIKAQGLFDPADRILLAVSGGADSTALIYVMVALKSEKVLRSDTICAHINHQLRGTDAELDEAFVTAQAAELKLAITTKRLDVRGYARKNKLSIETAARKLRIESLTEIAKANNCSRIATAHQKNDNAETVVHRLLRGTGFRGLGGIRPVRIFADDIRFVRPLLYVRRDEIVEYLEERNVKWREDDTNADCTYRRNFIRHRLLPALQKDCHGCIVEQLSELAESAREFYRLVFGRAEKMWPELADCGGNRVALNLKRFLPEPEPVKVELVRRSLRAVGSGERNLRQRHYERILQLAKQKVSNKKIELPDGFVVGFEYGKVIFSRQKDRQPKRQTSDSIELKVPGQTRFDNYLIEAGILEGKECDVEKFKAEKTQFVEWFDFDKVKLPILVRFREVGERFWPLGSAGEKKVGKFLTAARVPQEIRRKLLIISDSEKIIWVRPIRMSEQAKITGGTRKILQLQITDTNPAH
ncbi:MAG: tRNA lysidine(34) synthetase TilS [Planctomycetota bacterium]|jgi:tRNA(Ile)-lysidine synthase